LSTGCFVFGSTRAYFGSFVAPCPSVNFAGAPGLAAKRVGFRNSVRGLTGGLGWSLDTFALP